MGINVGDRICCICPGMGDDGDWIVESIERGKCTLKNIRKVNAEYPKHYRIHIRIQSLLDHIKCNPHRYIIEKSNILPEDLFKI